MAAGPTSNRTLRADLARARAAVVTQANARMRRSTTGRRMLLIGVASFVPVVVVSFVLGAALTRTAALTADVSTEVETLVTPVISLSDDLGGAQILLDRYFASGEEVDRQAFLSRARRIDTAFAMLASVEAAPEGSAAPAAPSGPVTSADRDAVLILGRVAAAEASWAFVRDTVAADGFTLPADPEERAGLLSTLGSETASVRGDLAEVADDATRRIAQLASDAERSSRGLRLLLLTAVPLAAILGILLVSWLIRDLRRGTRALREAAEKIENGRHGVRIPGLDHGDLAPVARAFNAMAEKMEAQSRELHEVANRDELTGVMNRRGFQTELDAELERAVRYERPMAFLLLDVDHFKSVNDTFGHRAGDVVLRAVADEIRDAVRGVDLVGRWGGEEFAVILPETPRADVAHVAERIARAIRRRVVIVEGDAIRVTASIGVAVHDLGVAHPEPGHLVDAADAALYRAKETGRDRVVFATG